MEVIQGIAQFLSELIFAGIAAVIVLFIVIAICGDVLRYIERRKETECGQADE